MQSVSAAFTAEAKDTVREPAHSLLVAWKKDTNTSNRTFTIGVSSIGGSDLIGLESGAFSSASIYQYEDESSYVTNLGWEHNLNMPLGGLTKGAGEFSLDNTSQRFTPDYMSGNSAIYTAVGEPKRPFIINAGFKTNGINETIPQFSGITNKPPQVNNNQKTFVTGGFDYADFLSNRDLNDSAMFTGIRTDVAISTLLNQAGLTTSQYDLDVGLNEIPFVLFENGDKMGNILNLLAQSEHGHMFQDEQGKYRFWNRQHWNNAPYNQIQCILTTAEVLNQEIDPQERLDSLVNVVEINTDYYRKNVDTVYYYDTSSVDSGEEIVIPSNATTEVWFNFEFPTLEITNSTFIAYSEPNYNGINLTSQITINKIDTFSSAAKYTITNNSSSGAYFPFIEIIGRYAEKISDIKVRQVDDSSVTAYEEKPITITNKYIQSTQWANYLADLILQGFSRPLNIQKLTIKAMPQLQLGDLISYSGIEFKILGIKTTYNVSSGFIQELSLTNSNFSTTTYFTIGISSIGGADLIAA